MKTEQEIKEEIERIGRLIQQGVNSRKSTTFTPFERAYTEQRIQILQAKLDTLLWVYGRGV